MTISIVSNLSSLHSQRKLNQTHQAQERTVRRLSTGERLNSARDNSAGLAISTRLRARMNSIARAERNTADAVANIQFYEGAYSLITSLLGRMRQLATQSANDSNSASDRALLNEEYSQLALEIDRIAHSTSWGDRYALLATSTTSPPLGSTVSFQVGPDADTNNQLGYDSYQVGLRSSAGQALSNLLSLPTDISTRAGARQVLGQAESSLEYVMLRRARLGALSNRMELAGRHLAMSREALADADSRIRDANIAGETANSVKLTILSQSGIAVLSQANSMPSYLLQLLSNPTRF